MSGGGGDGGGGDGGIGATDMGGYTDEQAAAVADAIDAATAASDASMGLGGYSAAQAQAVADVEEAMNFGMDPMGVVGNVADPNQALSLGLGASQNSPTTVHADFPMDFMGRLGRGISGLFGVSHRGYNINPDLTYRATYGVGSPGITSGIAGFAGLNGPSLFTFEGPLTSPGGGFAGSEDQGFDYSTDDPVPQRQYVQPVATPVAVVENVAAPVAAEPIFLNPTLLQRPSTLNVAPVNAPAGYGLLYPEQERRFQESYALRPEFYSGPLDTTGYQPVASLLI